MQIHCAKRVPQIQVNLGPEIAAIADVRLDYLCSMTDDVGLIQHATYNTPNRHEGYCTDDNVRGLLLASMLRGSDVDPLKVDWLDRRYRAFCNHAFDPDGGTIRNFMSFDRRWLENRGSDDCIGRVAWALGHCIGQATNLDVEGWAVSRFESALEQCLRNHVSSELELRNFGRGRLPTSIPRRTLLASNDLPAG